MKIKNLYASILEEDGTLRIYDYKNTITIKGNTYSISCNPNVYYQIYSIEKVKYTNFLKAKIVNRYVYKLRNEDNNNEQIYVSLSFFQNLKFILMNHKIRKVLWKLIKKIPGLVKIPGLIKWFIGLLNI